MKSSGGTKPVIKLRSIAEQLDMLELLKGFEDNLLEQILGMPESPDRTVKEKRLSIARGARRTVEWSLGIQDKALDESVIGPEWEVWWRAHRVREDTGRVR